MLREGHSGRIVRSLHTRSLSFELVIVHVTVCRELVCLVLRVHELLVDEDRVGADRWAVCTDVTAADAGEGG